MKDEQKIPKRKVKVSNNPLQQMFSLQKSFQSRFYDFEKMSNKEKIEYIRLMLTCINVESVEALNWTNWKPWKKTEKRFNRYEFLNELIDIQHFLINTALSVNCDSNEFSMLFINKNKENINRQKKGY